MGRDDLLPLCVVLFTDPDFRDGDQAQPAPGNHMPRSRHEQRVGFCDDEVGREWDEVFSVELIPDKPGDVMVDVVFVGKRGESAGIDENSLRLTRHRGRGSSGAEQIDREGL